jgi:type II secretory pathway pseudopilin PulG
MRWPKTRREWQAGTTLVEVLVATVIMALALALIVGTLSTGLLDSVLAKRNTASTAVMQYELDQIAGAPFEAAAQGYSDCFATEDATSPPTKASQGACPSTSYTLRADVTVAPGPGASQQWTVTVVQLPAGNPVGNPVSVLKVNR